MSLDIAQNMIV